MNAPKIPQTEIADPRPFWSVMIPVYNPGPYLRETLRSVLVQDPGTSVMQIEVVDDCSPNTATDAIVREVAGERIQIHRHGKNLGLCGAWNSAIARARGEWVHILHQDDLVQPGFYSAMRRGIEQFPNAGAAFCRHAYMAPDGHWTELSHVERRTTGLMENTPASLYTSQRIQCPSIVVRRSVYEDVSGFDPDFTHALDWEMWLRIAAKFPVLFEPQILACYRQHDLSVTSGQTASGENVRDIARMLRYARKYLPSESADLLLKQALRHVANDALERARRLVWQRRFGAARAQARAAIGCDASLSTLTAALWIWLRSREQEWRFPEASPKPVALPSAQRTS